MAIMIPKCTLPNKGPLTEIDRPHCESGVKKNDGAKRQDREVESGAKIAPQEAGD